ncbi:N-acetyltransferase [Sphingomonas metalli]|uniref:N-acetyltransferase n=1 Tax=Sphingomonas metalli TaxID=1779358 RepID=A0A916WRX7_9SPHN|nr:GNAT family N-acetyltransferase [Sphingomonas metalli]GGB27017.1 N-acetyltransferase [Sphingomonas metalli]
MQQVVNNRSEQEYVMDADGAQAVAAYQLEGDTIVFTHTVVPPAVEGRGIGSRLIRGALDDVRDQGLKVIPQCPFVRAFIQKHPEYRDLLR